MTTDEGWLQPTDNAKHAAKAEGGNQPQMLDKGPAVPEYVVEQVKFDILSLSIFFCSYFPKLLISPVVSILRGILCKCWRNIPSNPSASSTPFIHWNEGQTPVSLHPLWNNMHKFMLLDGKIAISNMRTSVSNVKLPIPGTHVHLSSPVLLCLSSPSTQ